jgi:hypothetical protein
MVVWGNIVWGNAVSAISGKSRSGKGRSGNRHCTQDFYGANKIGRRDRGAKACSARKTGYERSETFN